MKRLTFMFGDGSKTVYTMKNKNPIEPLLLANAKYYIISITLQQLPASKHEPRKIM